jgi:hypothetical protein
LFIFHGNERKEGGIQSREDNRITSRIFHKLPIILLNNRPTSLKKVCGNSIRSQRLSFGNIHDFSLNFLESGGPEESIIMFRRDKFWDIACCFVDSLTFVLLWFYE